MWKYWEEPSLGILPAPVHVEGVSTLSSETALISRCCKAWVLQVQSTVLKAVVSVAWLTLWCACFLLQQIISVSLLVSQVNTEFYLSEACASFLTLLYFAWCFLFRRETVFLSSLQQGFRRQIQSEGSSADPLGCEEIPVQKLLQNFLQNVSSAQTWGIWLLRSTLSHAVNVYLDSMHFSTPVPNDKWKSKGIFSSTFQPKKTNSQTNKKRNQQLTKPSKQTK